MSLQNSLKDFAKILREGVPDVGIYHYRRTNRKEAPYIVWSEDGEGETDLNTDNRKNEQHIHGYLDYFTLEEYDDRVDQIQEVFYEHARGWSLNDVQYEEDTNLIHYAWEFNL